MPNQENFRSDVTTNNDPRFIASRVVSFPEEGVLYEYLPASFGYNYNQFVEIHLYTIPGNSLLISMVAELETEGSQKELVWAEGEKTLRSHVVMYDDGSFKNHLRINFSKLFDDLNVIVIPGDYRMVLNFFDTEIGSYYNRKLFIQEISPSRTEIQLAFTDNTDEVNIEKNKKILSEFIPPSFPIAYAIGVAQKIFESGVDLEDSEEGLTYENIVDNIAVAILGQNYENTIARVNRLGLADQFREQVHQLLLSLFQKLRDEIKENGDKRIQEKEMKLFIKDIVNKNINTIGANNLPSDNRIQVT